MADLAPGGEQPQAPNPAPEITPAAPAAGAEKKLPEGSTASAGDVAKPTLDEALASIDIKQLTDTQLGDLESGDPARIASALGLPPPGQAVPEKKVTAPAAASQNATPNTEDEGPTRISLKAISSRESRSKLAQAMADLRDGKYSAIEDAMAFHFGLTKADVTAAAAAAASPEAGGNSSPATAPAAATVMPVKSEAVTALETKIADLAKQRETARTEFDYDKAEKLFEEITELRLDLRDAKRAAESQQSVQASFEEGEKASRAAALSKYSEWMTDPDSEFNDLLDYEIHLAERKADPILTKPNWPEEIANRVYEKHKVKFGGGTPDPDGDVTQTQIPPAPRPGVRVPGAPIGGSANTTALTATAAMAEFEALPHHEQMAVLAKLDAAQIAAR